MEMKSSGQTTHPVSPRKEKKNNCVQIPFRIKAAGKQKSIDLVQEEGTKRIRNEENQLQVSPTNPEDNKHRFVDGSHQRSQFPSSPALTFTLRFCALVCYKFEKQRSKIRCEMIHLPGPPTRGHQDALIPRLGGPALDQHHLRRNFHFY